MNSGLAVHIGFHSHAYTTPAFNAHTSSRVCSFTAGSILAATAILGLGKVLAATKAFKYKCMKCKLIQEYGQPGPKKCPNDRQMLCVRTKLETRTGRETEGGLYSLRPLMARFF